MTRNRHIQLLTIEYAANARGVVKTHSYEQARGVLLGTTYSDGTTARAYTYNHLGQLTQVVDDAGTRTIGYNAYNEQEADSLLAGGMTHLVTELRDDYGRSSGYTYANNGSVQQTVSTGYATDGRIASAGFIHGGAQKLFTYSYLPGTNLLQTLVKPNNMTLTQSYEPQRNLLTGMCYKRSNTTVAERTYTYDALGRPLTRTTARNGQTVTDSFGYNNRIDLTRSGHPCLWLLTWDPTQPSATRPLAIRKDGTWFAYGWDLTKNICEVYGPAGYIRTTYTYSPYGQVTASGDVTQPIQWSSEIWDDEPGLVYYNWRHYNAMIGRWIKRDSINELFTFNLYAYNQNNPIQKIRTRL